MVKLFMQPRFRGAPIEHNRFRRDLEDCRRLFHAQPAKEAQLDHFALPRVELCQTAESLVERDQSSQPFIGNADPLFEWDGLPSAPAFGRLTRPGMIYEHMPHGLGSHTVELSPILPWFAGVTRQLQIGLVDESRRLQGVIGVLPLHVPARQLVQLRVNHGHELLERGRIPVSESPEYITRPALQFFAPVYVYSSEGRDFGSILGALRIEPGEEAPQLVISQNWIASSCRSREVLVRTH